MARVSGDRVWKALLKERRFCAEVPEDQRPIFEPYVKALPKILADMLGQPVTLMTLMKAKAIFIRHCLDNGLIGNFMAVVPEEQLLFMDRASMGQMMEQALQGALSIMESIVEDVPNFLQSVGVTEEQVISNPKTGISDENIKRYQKGKLMLADLLLSQPSVIVKNTD